MSTSRLVSEPVDSTGEHAEIVLPEALSNQQLASLAGGLSSAQVRSKHESGESNEVDQSTSRPLSAILRANLFTTFNAILFTCAAAVLILGDWRDAVFGFVLVLNLAIGVLSELRSKKELDSLAVLQAPTSTVLRDGQWQEVNNSQLVSHDVIRLSLGDQVPADGQVIEARGLEVDESALTGEARPVRKKTGDTLMSGTAIVAGAGEMLIEVVGSQAWAQRITSEARRFSKAHSEIQDSIERILHWVTIILPVIFALLLWSQMRAGGDSWPTAIVYTVAGIVGMIPQGLVLLTSMNFGLAAALLARRGVLVQELPAVEILARVDVLCLDKTGTLTTGEIRGRAIVDAPQGLQQSYLVGGEKFDGLALSRAVLASLVADGGNATAEAVKQLVPSINTAFTEDALQIPFNSARKWSALHLTCTTDAPKTWVLGAPEILLADGNQDHSWAHETVSAASSVGRRSVCLSYTDSPLGEEQLPAELRPALIAVLEEDIRPDAKQTLEYFAQQGVLVKVISGDAPETVATIAAEVGLRHEGGGVSNVIDARKLPDPKTPEFQDLALNTDVFGRVTPEQKRELVRALKRAGHTVAMTGDGVNDALALKDADLGIAMGNAAPATKAVSRLVLVNGKFSDLPGVVAEGRRIIANMERVSALFLSKTTYAILFAILVAALGWKYPFLPRQLTYIGTFTIGVPAFFLSLAPNPQKYRPGFLRRTLLVAVPSGAILTMAASAAYLVLGEGTELGQTGATISLIIGAMALLIVLARPWNWWRITLVVLMISGAVIGMTIEPVRRFFALELPHGGEWYVILIAGLCAAILIATAYGVTSKWRAHSNVQT
ncbi:HAD-IC family P-type ATPase [Actinomyces minihominis]|uniref:HAD-IC family P-type ATPase n=1 Tax=Actinomyces minihominis TaxID=2002838 RepID=UPI001F5CD79E|nr:HAD-IC family P-type ATPase [Actinomyces minihominis]